MEDEVAESVDSGYNGVSGAFNVRRDCVCAHRQEGHDGNDIVDVDG